MEDDEEVEAVVFGDWGWGNYEEVEEDLRIPENRRGQVLTPYEAGLVSEEPCILRDKGALIWSHILSSFIYKYNTS